MPDEAFVPLAGSERLPISGVEPAGPLDVSAWIEVTLVTRRKAELPADLVTGPMTLTRERFEALYGTADTDLALIRRVLARFGVEITETDAGARRVKAAGTIAALSEAFRTSLRLISSPGLVSSPGGIGGPGQVEHRYRVGGLSLPAELDGVVLAVFGLDDRPQAASQLRWAPAAGGGASYTPPQVAQAYGFPAGTCVAGHRRTSR